MKHCQALPRITAHRGLSWDFPENTLVAFVRAIDQGPDYVELDFRTTCDGRLVCIHDHVLDRYLAGAQPSLAGLRIESLTLEQLKQVDMGGWKAPRFAGTPVATLEEVVSLFSTAAARRAASLPPTPVLMIEHKTGTPAQLLDAVSGFERPEQFVVMSFDWTFLAALHSARPEVRLAALGRGTMTPAQIVEAKGMGCFAMHWDLDVTTEDVAAVHAAGLELWVYTLNHPLTWLGAQALGVDALATDRCDQAIRLLRGQGDWTNRDRKR